MPRTHPRSRTTTILSAVPLTASLTAAHRRARRTLGAGRPLKAVVLGAALALGLAGAGPAAAAKVTPPATATVTWAGNGTTVTDGTRTLNTVLCDESNTPYLLWVLSGSKATTASIDFGGGPLSMGQPGINKKTGISTFKYTMPGTIDLDTATVVATYNDAKNKATLAISHGCRGTTGVCYSPNTEIPDILVTVAPTVAAPRGTYELRSSGDGTCSGAVIFSNEVTYGDIGCNDSSTALPAAGIPWNGTAPDSNWYFCSLG